MKQRKRTIFFVDRSVQGSLMLRFVGYWAVCLTVMFGLLAAVPILLATCFPFFADRPSTSQILTDTWSMFWPAMTASLLILPAVLWDLIRMSNRFVGPIYRLRRSMRALADGETVDPVRFRKGDYWFEFGEDFNRVIATAQSTESSRGEEIQPATSAKEDAPKEEAINA